MTFTGNNGAATLDIEGTVISGFFSDDGSMGVFRFASSELGDDSGRAQIGMIVLIKLPQIR